MASLSCYPSITLFFNELLIQAKGSRVWSYSIKQKLEVQITMIPIKGRLDMLWPQAKCRVGPMYSFAKARSLIRIGATWKSTEPPHRRGPRGAAKFPTVIYSASIPTCGKIPKALCHRDQSLPVSLENVQVNHYQLPTKTTKLLVPRTFRILMLVHG